MAATAAGHRADVTPKSSLTRLFLYVLIATCATASAGVLTVDFADPKQVAVFALAIVASGLNTARSYIDTSNGAAQQP